MVKSSYGTKLNELGEQIAALSEVYLSSLDSIIKQYKAGNSATRKISCPSYCLDIDSFPARIALDIMHIAKKHFIDIEIYGEFSEDEIINKIYSSQADLAIGYIYKMNDDYIINPYNNLNIIPLCNNRYVCLVSKYSLWAKLNSISIKNLTKELIVYFDLDTKDGYIDFLKKIIGEKNNINTKKLKTEMAYNNWIALDKAVSIIPDVIYKNSAENIQIYNTVQIKIRENICREAVLLTRKDSEISEEIKKIIELTKNHVQFILR